MTNNTLDAISWWAGAASWVFLGASFGRTADVWLACFACQMLATVVRLFADQELTHRKMMEMLRS